MLSRVRLWLLTASVLFSPIPASAQIGQTAVLLGVIRDATGAALPGATVTASSPSLMSGSRQTVSDAEGVYRFPSLAPGVYRIEAEHAGFNTAKRANLRLELG